MEFKKNELVKTVKVQTKEDGLNDDNEYFVLDLYKTEAAFQDGEYSAYGKAFIANNGSAATAVNDYKYTVTGANNTSAKAATEGVEPHITFTIVRSRVDGNAIGNSDIKSKVYLSTTHSTTDSEDIESLDKKALEFGKKETTKTITIKTYADSETEGSESFYLDLFKTEADAEEGIYHAWDQGYLFILRSFIL